VSLQPWLLGRGDSKVRRSYRMATVQGSGTTPSARPKSVSAASLTAEHVKVLERDNQALRRRVAELESKHCIAGDVGVLVHKAVVEAARQVPPDQRLAAISARVSSLEAELHSRSTQAEEERGRHADAQRAQLEQNLQLTRTIEELGKREEEHKSVRREVVELKERLQVLSQQERHAREDASREVASATRLQEELTKSRTDKIDTLKRVHDKYKEQLDVQNGNMEALREKIRAQERQIGEAMESATRAEELIRQGGAHAEVSQSVDRIADGLGKIGESVGKVSGMVERTEESVARSGTAILEGVQRESGRVLDEVGRVSGEVKRVEQSVGEGLVEWREGVQKVLSLLDQLSASAERGVSKADLEVLADSVSASEEYKVTMAALEERFSEMRQALVRLGEEYGTVMGRDDDLVAGLSSALRGTLRASEDRLQTEIRRGQDQHARFEQEKQDFQRHQDKLVRTIEQQLDQISTLSRSKGMSDEEVKAISAI
jgi:chromosome segregation ATPase